MPYANNAGIKIHYQVDGAGPPLVLQHGFTQCVDDWIECGYVTELARKHRVILIDARGHGLSDKPHEPTDYTLNRRVADITVVLDALNVETAHFWGYSMGGLIGFGMAKYAPDRLRNLVIGGQHPFAAERSSIRRWICYGMSNGRDALVAAFENTNGPIAASYAARMRTADLDAWFAAIQDRDGMEDMLTSMAMPCCLYAGDVDPAFAEAKMASERIRNARFFSLPGLSHMQAFYESSAVLPPVIDFLGAPRDVYR
jgi:pimeloyl-ACP methyl ester carboxylesterase